MQLTQTAIKSCFWGAIKVMNTSEQTCYCQCLWPLNSGRLWASSVGKKGFRWNNQHDWVSASHLSVLWKHFVFWPPLAAVFGKCFYLMTIDIKKMCVCNIIYWGCCSSTEGDLFLYCHLKDKLSTLEHKIFMCNYFFEMFYLWSQKMVLNGVSPTPGQNVSVEQHSTWLMSEYN